MADAASRITDQADSITASSIRLRTLITQYYRLTKPGIVYSNVMTAVAGYLFASRWHVVLGNFLGLIVGTGLLIAASCVLNNVIDRRIDARMQRTRKRALVTGLITPAKAAGYAAVLAVVGLWSLLHTNWLTVGVGIIAVISYVAVYGLAKRRSVHGTLVGTLPGAAALVAGYAAVTNRLDVAALLLFLTMVVWQMAHFYSIAIFRRDDYASAGVPVRSVVKGITNTRRQIIVYIVLFTAIAPLVSLTHRAGYAYALAMVAMGLVWLRVALRPSDQDSLSAWARQTFGYSLITLLVLSAALALGPLLP